MKMDLQGRDSAADGLIEYERNYLGSNNMSLAFLNAIERTNEAYK